jgi:hypothetical protein
MYIKPTQENINQAVDAKIRDRNLQRKFHSGHEKFNVKVKDPKTQLEYEIRYFF